MVFDNKKHLIILLLPALLVLCIFAIYPVIQVTFYSFFEVDFVGDGPSIFVGLRNYDELFDDYFFATRQICFGSGRQRYQSGVEEISPV